MEFKSRHVLARVWPLLGLCMSIYHRWCWERKDLQESGGAWVWGIQGWGDWVSPKPAMHLSTWHPVDLIFPFAAVAADKINFPSPNCLIPHSSNLTLLSRPVQRLNVRMSQKAAALVILPRPLRVGRRLGGSVVVVAYFLICVAPWRVNVSTLPLKRHLNERANTHRYWVPGRSRKHMEMVKSNRGLPVKRMYVEVLQNTADIQQTHQNTQLLFFCFLAMSQAHCSRQRNGPWRLVFTNKDDSNYG